MSLFAVKIRVHPLFLVVLALAAYAHYLVQALMLFGIVLLHEFGHVVAAARYGYRTESVELLPFGGVAKLGTRNLGWNSRHETVIAISGPLVNLLLTVAALGLHVAGLLPERFSNEFVTINLTLGLFNLLPGLPLDGGRIARAGLALTRGYEAATRAVTRMSFYLATALMIMGALSLWLGYADSGLLALGVFLLFSAYTLQRHSRYDTLRFLDAKRRDHGASPLPMRALVVSDRAAIGDIAATFSPGAYHMIYVRDSMHSEQLAKPITEQRVLEAIFERGMWTESISELLL
ncbi:MAG: M50 family metallopeptidase [Bacilli bacterium]